MTEGYNGPHRKHDGKNFIDWVELWFKKHDDAEEISRKGLDHRLDGMNEIRQQLATQKSEFATREYVDGKLDALAVKVDAMKNMAGLALLAALGSIIVFVVTRK